MKKVLITLDYNPNSEKVVNKGQELAKLMGAEICLLHVLAEVRYYGMQYEPFMGYEGYAFPVDFRIQEEFVKVAKDYLEKTAAHLGGENVTTHLAEGDTAKSILEYAESWNADVIVMGTHSHGTLEKIFLGTVASSVLERTEIPVYMVPTGEK
ncbi:universal stress protein [Aequorivita sp. F47161]|jgi:nucleotide-binding universal stress UspA family protein|uniref:Universal stress protein n=1 Tax=Aequorivita vitellina TaxID=2874475 RepID=A0A9X1U2X8_9FLAO|nr:universal stress protein [Aequorivita vitellina]MCG2418697.1 universal stress protein [Aequorivita vitellina]MCZ4320030.1 universal stress protein [Aequorivita viscosa]